MSATTPLNNVVAETAKKGIENMKSFKKSYPKIPDDRMYEILDNLSSVRYDYMEDWFRIGCALKNGGYSFEMFDYFSSKSTKLMDNGKPTYTQANTRKTWDSISNTLPNGKKPFTIAGLKDYLKQDLGEEEYKKFRKWFYVEGNTRPRISFDEDDYTWHDFLDDIREENNVVYEFYLPRLQRVCAYIEDGADSEIILKVNKLNKPLSIQNYTAFINSCKKHTYRVTTTGANGEESSIQFTLDKFISKYLVDITYREIVFFPYSPIEDPPETEYQFNIFSGLLVKYDDETETDELYRLAEPIFNHIFEVNCNSRKDYYDYVIKWLAHMFQKPRELPGTNLVFTGKQGAGKGIIVQAMLEKIFGQYSLYVLSLGQITGKFNGRLEYKILCNCDEAKAKKKSSDVDYSIMKGILTNPTLEIERKGKESHTINNYIRVISTSNKPLPVKLEEGERRTFLVEVSDKYVKNKDYFINLGNILKNGVSIPAFYNYLLRIDISNFHPCLDLIMTDEKEYFTESLRNSLDVFMSVFDWNFTEFSFTEKRNVVVNLREKGCTSEQLFNAYVNWCNVNNHKTIGNPKSGCSIQYFRINVKQYVNIKRTNKANFYLPK